MKRTRFVCAVILILCSGSLFAHDDENAIREAVKKMEAGIVAGDAERAAAMYASDATLMPPNEPPVKGAEAIRKWWGGMLGVGKAKLAINIEKLIVSGDLAVDVGTWDLNLVPAGATDAVKDHGKYIVVWRKRDGKWQAVNDIFNSDVAPAKKAD
jgi:uncharacterized protein (TIGR02246 family)